MAWEITVARHQGRTIRRCGVRTIRAVASLMLARSKTCSLGNSHNACCRLYARSQARKVASSHLNVGRLRSTTALRRATRRHTHASLVASLKCRKPARHSEPPRRRPLLRSPTRSLRCCRPTIAPPASHPSHCCTGSTLLLWWTRSTSHTTRRPQWAAGSRDQSRSIMRDARLGSVSCQPLVDLAHAHSLR